MPNSYFQFKQFTVQQDRCAMKVCTDACLFGAFISTNQLVSPDDPSASFPCLDIGTGTGLLSLMLAQKNPKALIDAVEIDAQAAAQATENFAASPWKDRLRCINTDILSFSPEKKYTFIFSNPPFFEDDLRSADARKNNAKHDTVLHLARLVQRAQELLSEKGVFAALLPGHRVDYFIEAAAEQGLALLQKVWVKQTDKHGHFRGIVFVGHRTANSSESVICIKNEETYSPEFVELLKDYYLYL